MQKIKIKLPVCGCDRSEIIGDEVIFTKCPICKKDYEEQEVELIEEKENDQKST